MSFRRVCTVAGRLMILALAVLMVPACKKQVDLAPHLMGGVPLPDAVDVPHFPLMVLEWDKDLDESTFAANVAIFETDVNGNPDFSAPWGNPITISFISGTFQMVIETTAAFTSGVEYAVFIFDGLLSADGHSAGNGLALRFTVVNSLNTTLPAFSVLPSQAAGGNTGEIIWNWTAPAGSTIDFYMSPTTEGEDLLALAPFFTSNSTSGDTILAAKGLVSGNTYFFRVIIRDSAGNVNVIDEISGVAR